MQLSKENQNLVEAYNRGYRISNNEIISPKGKTLKKCIGIWGYPKFNISINDKTRRVAVHKLVAYQVYGDRLFEPGIEVRHVDDDSRNCFETNICLGTRIQNENDKSKERKKKGYEQKSLHMKKEINLTHVEILKLYATGEYSKSKLSRQFNFSIRTIRWILTKSYTAQHFD